MSKLDKSESSRRNGAKSNGPVSPEGRQRSSQNAMKTGLYSNRVYALTTEKQEELDKLRQDYLDEWEPADRRQADLVEKIVDAEWRYIRFGALENWAIEDMLTMMEEEVKTTFTDIPPCDLRAGLAYARVYEANRALENFQRERQRLSRIIDRFTRLLKELQDQDPPAENPIHPCENENSRNEPENTPAGTSENENIGNEPENSPTGSSEKENNGNEPEIPAESPAETPQSYARIWRTRQIHKSEPQEVSLAMAS